MNRTGVMAEIRRRLTAGQAPKALIAEGYKSGSVYKVRWELDKQGLLPTGHVETGGKKPSGNDDGKPTSGNDEIPDLPYVWAALAKASAREPLIRGDLSIYKTALPSLPRVLFHPERGIPCPKCHVEVSHWEWCAACRGFMSGDCDCDDHEVENQSAYTFEQLVTLALIAG